MKKLVLILLEIITIIFILGTLFILSKDKYDQLFNHFPKYKVEFQDIDGIGIGSPVKFMGMRAGHVIKTELKNTRVIITFKITDKNIKLPSGCFIGIEFSGLGGSKSLEIFPPTSKIKDNDGFQTMKPLRVSTLTEIQELLSEATLEVLNSTFLFFKENEKNDKSNISKTAKYFRNKSETMNKALEYFDHNTISRLKGEEKLKGFLQQNNTAIDSTRNFIEKYADSGQINDSLENLMNSVNECKRNLIINNKKLDEFNNNIKKFNNQAKSFNTEINKIKNRELNYLEDFNKSIKLTSEKIRNFADFSKKQEEKLKSPD